MSTLVGTPVGALVGAFVGPFVDPLVGSNFGIQGLYQAIRVATLSSTQSVARRKKPFPLLRVERKKTHKEQKTRKQNFHRKVPGFWGESCLCVFSPP